MSLENEKLCSVCEKEVLEDAEMTCKHFLCEDCVEGMCTTACPLCRFSPIQNSFITDEVLKSIKEKHKKQNVEIASDFPYSEEEEDEGDWYDPSSFVPSHDLEHFDADGKLHSENGPAVICDNGDKFWYIHGELHRKDGPAIVYADGGKEWYIIGQEHRVDGPA